MYKICQTEQSSLRQRALEKGFLELLQKQSYEDISISDLCAHLQIPRKTFYRYFSHKDGILYSMIDHTLVDFFSTPLVEKKYRGTGADELQLFFAFWYKNKAFLDALEHSHLSGILVERANVLSLQEGYMPRQFKSMPPDSQDLVMAFSVCGLMSMVLRWHHQGFLLSPEEMSSLAIKLLTAPLLNP